MRLVLVRHAEAAESARGRCYGSLDVGLSARGMRQRALLADALARDPVSSVVSSPRIRALETARPIAERHGLDVRAEPELQELDFGELEGRTYDEIAASMPVLYAEWMTRPTRVRFPGGECYADLARRSLRAVGALRDEFTGRTVVVVTHGGVVRAVLADALGITDDRIFRLAVDPASRTVVEWVDDVPLVVALNDRA
ncbi:MAG TPA: histidine phosphatase family protein [Gaiella sp.]|jgi:alpha-ribazole phosphatase/probable phosphoglycerate mutase